MSCKRLWGRELVLILVMSGMQVTAEVLANTEVPWMLMDVESQAYHRGLNLLFEKPQGWQFQEEKSNQESEPFKDWHVVFQLIDIQNEPLQIQSSPASISLTLRASFDQPLSQFAELVRDGIQLTHPTARRLSDQSREFLGYPAHQMTFTISVPPTHQDMLVTLLCAVDETIGYILSYTGDESQFLEKMSAFETVARTLRFENAQGLNRLMRHWIIAEDYRFLGDWDRATQELEQALPLGLSSDQEDQIKKELCHLYGVMGQAAFVKEGNLIRAEKLFHRTLELEPNQPQIEKTLELVRVALKNEGGGK